MTGKSAALPVAQKLHWPLIGAFSDLRIRYGIKLGLAGLLALYCALLLRLEHPSWAVLTALVMMGSHYVGAITVKAIMRVLGTIGGVLEFVPVVGPLAGALIIVTVALLMSYKHWLILIIFLGIWRLLQDYVSSPRIMGESMELHPLAAIFGVMAGGEVAGILGIYLSIPVMASLRIVFRRWRLYAEKKKFGPLTDLPLRSHEAHRP